ncbi:MAG: branched-chain amino acid ABC transporter permease [Peptococcaceae bacterium]|nr:branched-chain amino acid ABC transporter permease [Peptococcaceae bacterium]
MLLQQLINGITLGSTYALIALGYTMVYGIIALINFAHGEIFMAGAFAGLFMVTVLKINIFLSLILSMVFCMIMGVVIERIAYRPLRKSSRLSALISAIGVSIFLSTLALMVFGADAKGFPDNTIPLIQIKLGPAEISSLQLLILGISAFLMMALEFIVRKTKIGKAMRATSQDYHTASLMGVNVNRVISVTFALGSSLAAAGGVLVGILYNSVSFNMGLMAGLKAFAAAVLGGIGSIPGAMFGGIFLGVAEVMGVAAGYSSYRDAIAFAILVLVLLIKPTGLFGQKIQKKV